MTEQTNIDSLIAEAWQVLSRPIPGDHESEEARGVIRRLADALEAADQRAEEAESDRDLFKREQVRLAARCDQAQNERDALAAVIEQAEDHLTRHFLDMLVADEVLPILASAPADALREVKADVWDEGADAMAEHIDNGAWWEIQNPYRGEQS